MVELGFLNSKDDVEDSTVKSREVNPAIQIVIKGTTAKKATITYNQDKAHLRQAFPVQAQQLPYIIRAVEYVKSIGYTVHETLYEAMSERVAGKKALSYREADIAFRLKTSSQDFLLTAMLTFDAFMTECDSKFMAGTYVLRARYNKGIAWLKNPERTEEQKKEGNFLLAEFNIQLRTLGLPMHPEEVQEGFHEEFLKPEYMTKDQFQREIKFCLEHRTIEELELIKGMHNATHNVNVDNVKYTYSPKQQPST